MNWRLAISIVLLSVLASTAAGLLESGLSDTDTDARGEAEEPDRLRALLLEPDHLRSVESHTEHLLKRAGFSVFRLHTNTASLDKFDLLVFGANAARDSTYNTFIARRSNEVLQFVHSGGVVLQFPQHTTHEVAPTWLPSHVRLTRAKAPFSMPTFEEPVDPLLVGLPSISQGGEWALPLRGELEAIPEGAVFSSWDGCRVLLFSPGARTWAYLLEAAHGRGRILISSIALWSDSQRVPIATGRNRRVPREVFEHWHTQWGGLSRIFLDNLHDYVGAVSKGQTPSFQSSPEYRVAPATALLPEAWKLVVLPDTQNAIDKFPKVFKAQIDWIVRASDSEKIRFVVHVGDITEHNSPREWDLAKQGLSRLDGVVPYLLVTGNHDYAEQGKDGVRSTLLNDFFGAGSRGPCGVAAHMFESGRRENGFCMFDVDGQPWLVLGLEYDPRDAILDWGREVLSARKNFRTIIVTHSFMYDDDLRIDGNRIEHRMVTDSNRLRESPEGSNDGEQVWTKLIQPAGNVNLVLSGHVTGDGAGRRSDKDAKGHVVHQMLSNYQDLPDGGSGFLRILQFLPDGQTVLVSTYSPFLDAHLTDTQNQFELKLSKIAE